MGGLFGAAAIFALLLQVSLEYMVLLLLLLLRQLLLLWLPLLLLLSCLYGGSEGAVRLCNVSHIALRISLCE